MAGRYIHNCNQEPGQLGDSENSTGGPFNNSNYGLDESRAIACSQPDLTLKMLRDISEIGLTLPIALFGIVGNIISLVVLCYLRRLNKIQTILVQLQALAVVDTLILLCTLFLRSFRYLLSDNFMYIGIHTAAFPYLYPTIYYFRLLGIWLTVLLTVDRYIAVWYPLDAKRLCTLSRTYILMALIAVYAMLFTIPRYFEYTVRTHPESGKRGFESTWLLDNYTYGVAYRILAFISLQYVVPTVILVCLNASVIVALRRSDTYRRKSTATPLRPMTSHPSDSTTPTMTSPPPAFQSTRSITIVVVVIVTICIVVHLVALVAHIVWSIQLIDASMKSRLEPTRRHLSQASNVLVALNSAVNFIIYCLFSRNFRSVLLRRLRPSCHSCSTLSDCCRHGAWRRWRGDSSKRSTSTLPTNHSDARPNALHTPLVALPVGTRQPPKPEMEMTACV